MLKNIFSEVRVRTFLIILVSFLLVTNGSSLIFIADSPRVNPEFVARIKNVPSNLIARIKNSFIKESDDVFVGVKLVTPPSDVVFKPFTKGVSAAEDTNTRTNYIKVEAGTKYRIVGTVVIDGKEYPKIEFIE